VIDTLHIVETPEGVELELPVAGPVPRLLAWGIDTLLQGAGLFALVVVSSAAGLSDGAGVGVFYILLFLALWFYSVAFEVWNRGRTPGKLAVGLQVVCDDGTPIGFGASIVRNFLRIADWLPTGYALGFLCMCFDTSFRRVGDLAAGTLVIYTPRRLAEPPPLRVTPRVSPVQLEPDERRAVIAFASRAHLLSSTRAEELAAAAAPLLEPGSLGTARERISQIAAWLMGSPAAETANGAAWESAARSSSASASGSTSASGSREAPEPREVTPPLAGRDRSAS